VSSVIAKHLRDVLPKRNSVASSEKLVVEGALKVISVVSEEDVAVTGTDDIAM
jgi:hypothetical protein